MKKRERKREREKTERESSDPQCMEAVCHLISIPTYEKSRDTCSPFFFFESGVVVEGGQSLSTRRRDAQREREREREKEKREREIPFVLLQDSYISQIKLFLYFNIHPYFYNYIKRDIVYII